MSEEPRETVDDQGRDISVSELYDDNTEPMINPFEDDDLPIFETDQGIISSGTSSGNADAGADEPITTLAVGVEVYPCDYCSGSDSPSISFSLSNKPVEGMENYFSLCGKCLKEAMDYLFQNKRERGWSNRLQIDNPKIINPDDIYKGLIGEINNGK